MSYLNSDQDPKGQNTDWKWPKEFMEAFAEENKKISDTPTLEYRNPDKELVLQVGSLGAALMHNGKPMEHAYRPITNMERRLAHI